MNCLEFTDNLIPYETFLKDVASTVVRMLRNDLHDPEYISQREAYKLFGRRNVERWRKQARVTPIKRPGKLEYRTADLRFLQRSSQDYLVVPEMEM
jgi:hypothetical protein